MKSVPVWALLAGVSSLASARPIVIEESATLTNPDPAAYVKFGRTVATNGNFNDWVSYWYGFGRPFTELGGNWEITGEADPEGLSQTDPGVLAFAYNGVPVGDQVIRANIRLGSYAPSAGAWFGLLARYVDENNYYFLSMRSTNQLQIRKVVNGVVTVLRAVAYTAHDGRLVATALDDALPRGKYGMGTYRATATWQDFVADQP